MKCIVSFLVTVPCALCFLDGQKQQDVTDNTLKNTNITNTSDVVSISVINGDNWADCIGPSEDASLNFTQLTKKYGYPIETHTVTTEDNYILTIFRLIKGKQCKGEIKATPVIMMHGLADSSDTWIISKPDSALGYLVSDACYDVWLPNQRGNSYSKGHLYYTADKHSEKYWNFSFDEFGRYDLKAIVDYVLDVTDSKQVSYIGHSQGSTDFYVLTSTLPEYNEKFTVCISLAPIAWVHNLRSPLLRLAAPATPELLVAGDLLQIREVFNRDDVNDKFPALLCQFLPAALCGLRMMIVGGGDPTTLGCVNIKTSSGHFPDSTSSKNLGHYGQEVNVDKFQKYDYGAKGNLEVYNSSVPPEYDVTKITAPVALIASEGDLVSDVKDVAKLRARLQNVVYYGVMDERWGHVHYVLAKTVPSKLAPTVFRLLEKYGS